jgi:hypothetical protein
MRTILFIILALLFSSCFKLDSTKCLTNKEMMDLAEECRVRHFSYYVNKRFYMFDEGCVVGVQCY